MRASCTRFWALASVLLSLSGCWLDSSPPVADAGSSGPDVGQIADVIADVATPADMVADVGTGPDSTWPPDVGTPKDADAPPAWFACKQAADCAAVEIGCCDHCNGGKLMAANKNYAGDVKFTFGAKDCGGVPCTAMGCAFPPTLACQQGQCAIGAPASPCGDLSEAACNANGACMPYFGSHLEQACFDMGPSPSTQVFLGCIKFQPCNAVLGCATSPGGEKFYVPDVCEAPPGWSVTGVSCCDAAPCKAAQQARFCVRGKSGSQGEAIAVGDPILVNVFPAGCWSSSCTKAQKATCDVQWSGGEPWDNVNVGGSFCLLDTSNGSPCTADCSGGLFATCSGGTWAAGSHTVNMGGLKLTIEVPSVVPFGGVCVGMPF